MKDFRYLIMKYPLRLVIVVAIIIASVVATILIASIQGWSETAYRHADTFVPALQPDEEIAGWSNFDKDSYYMGENAIVRIRVLYRDDAVSPNFETFGNQISFQPFEQQEVATSIRSVGGNIKEYLLEYKLQAMGTKLSGGYVFNPAILYYKKLAEADQNIYTLRIQQPQIYVSSFYPSNIRGIDLHPLKGELLEPSASRQGIMFFAALLFGILSGFLLWKFGRRRSVIELSIPERLWQEFNEFRAQSLDNRTYLLKCERVFSGLLTGHARVSPDKFWSGAEVDYGHVANIAEKVRGILRRIYQSPEPLEADVEEISILLEETLSSLVEEERLQLEREPTYIDRLKKQPDILLFSGILMFLAILSFFLAGWPMLWSSSDINRYNQAEIKIQNGLVIDVNPYAELIAIAEESNLGIVKAAAYYNAGTLRANQSFASSIFTLAEQPEQHNLMLRELFRPQSAENFLHELSGHFFHTEDEIIVSLTSGAEHLLRAELDLQAAVRAQTGDIDIHRNLELIVKRRWALLSRLAQIRDYYEEKNANREEDEIFSDTGLVDIINSKLPEEFSDEEVRSDDRGYIIFERF